MPICTTCNTENSIKFFTHHRVLLPVCRTCRIRDTERKRIQAKRLATPKQAPISLACARQQRAQAVALAKRIKTRSKRVKTRFMALTAIIRGTIKKLSRLPITEHRTKYLDERKDQLRRYTEAYERQLREIYIDNDPDDILSLM